MKFRNIFWGVILIFAGVLFILQNLGLIYFDWVSLWRLWPVILVLWGVSIIPVNNWIKLILVLLVLGGSVTFMLNRSVSWGEDRKHFDIELFGDDFFDEEMDDNNRKYTTQTFNIPYEDSSKYVKLKMEAAAGKFTIKEESENLLNFKRKGNSAEYSYIIKSIDSTSVIDIEMESAAVNVGKKHKNTVNIALNDNPIWDINLEAGAASVDFDLSDYNIKRLDIDGGAASIKIILGDKYEKTHLDIEAGASSILIKLPEESGCLLNLESVFSGKKIQGFEKTDHGKYKTANFEESENKIYIDAETAVSSFTIIRY
jgi:hypothetical protein